MAGLIELGNSYSQQAKDIFSQVAGLQQRREAMNEKLQNQDRAGDMQLMGMGAGAGGALAAGTAVGGPVGAGIGLGVGLLGSELL